MKFRKFGHAMLAAVVSAGMVLGLTSCTSSFTVAYFYVVGQQYNQITGYRVDNNTGKLRAIVNLPIGTGGTKPIQDLILPAGKFLYVLNQGATDTANTGAGVSRFIIGQKGVLTQQEGLVPSQGKTPLRFAVDSSGSYMYVLDSVAPSSSNCPNSATTCSDITVFKIDGNTGRLVTVVNQQQRDAQGVNLTYFPVPGDAIDMAFMGSTIYIAHGKRDQQQYVTAYNASSGQVTISSTGTQTNPAVNINALIAGYTSSNAVGATSPYIYILDQGPKDTSTGYYTHSRIYSYTQGSNGSLASVNGSPLEQNGSVNNPFFLLRENSGKAVYVANRGDAADSSYTSGAGYITAYTLTSSGQDTGLLTVQNQSPFTTQAGPRCLIQDPSNQYIYSIDYNANNITLKRLSTNAYDLQDPRGASNHYTTINQPVWGVMTNRTE